MIQINYSAMTDKDLRQYFLKHREDKIALQMYLDRLSKRSNKKVITTLDDPDFDEKIQAAIREQMEKKG
ncbi:MAG: hypothetical protein F6K40_10005 [Okeania sp. SIO3I5]|uniref:DUF6887 family protein n=1 Tax=Okeania sp. SIO3I5 TaxID=2607805 RepID=UPI0013B8895E|nr:hypothetical protein [Okeania sp. SIO3I5]NEQ36589.1 hypothetical protein [Okeania sp. SIO3I5]